MPASPPPPRRPPTATTTTTTESSTTSTTATTTATATTTTTAGPPPTAREQRRTTHPARRSFPRGPPQDATAPTTDSRKKDIFHLPILPPTKERTNKRTNKEREDLLLVLCVDRLLAFCCFSASRVFEPHGRRLSTQMPVPLCVLPHSFVAERKKEENSSERAPVLLSTGGPDLLGRTDRPMDPPPLLDSTPRCTYYDVRRSKPYVS
mmetsp:Transcript_12347/g.40371  ORF Transcript_12347/g.40371 Transcript_12347/m.40371 type:complete len:207 (+) Transcript_12347:3000-3620(+)